MPGASDIPTGNIQNILMIQSALTPSAVNTITAPEQTFTVNGLLTTDMVFINKPSAQAGLGIAGARVSAANTLAITYVNPTVGNITPTAETYTILVVRQENPGNLPTNVS